MGIINDGGGESEVVAGGSHSPPGGGHVSPQDVYNPIFESPHLSPGLVVAIMTAARAPHTGIVPNSVLVAEANGAGSTYAIGVVSQHAQPGQRGLIRYMGPLTLPAAEWAAAIDIGGALAQGVPYYVSAASPGKITQTAPAGAGDFVKPIGYALAPDSLFVNCSFSAVAVLG
jgi:hypothetical protein